MLSMIFAMQRLISNMLYCVLFVYFHFGVKGRVLNFAVCVSLCKVVSFLCTFTLASKGAREFRRHLRSAISVLVDRVYILKGTLFYLRSSVLYLIKENEFPHYLSSLPTDYNFQY